MFIAKLHFDLQVIEYKSRKRRRREKRALASIDKPETAPGDVTIWQEALHIPPLPPTGLSRCELIDVGYELQVGIVANCR